MEASPTPSPLDETLPTVRYGPGSVKCPGMIMRLLSRERTATACNYACDYACPFLLCFFKI